MWHRAVDVGRRILWLHTFGERYIDPAAGRPAGVPRLPVADRPRCVEEIPDTPEKMPNEKLRYDPETGDLWIGEGKISPVPQQVRDYAVSGMNVLDKWHGYRKKEPAGKKRLPLDFENALGWAPEWTTELLELLNVLGLLVREEPAQQEVLTAICDSPLITTAVLTSENVLPVPPGLNGAVKRAEDDGALFDL